MHFKTSAIMLLSTSLLFGTTKITAAENKASLNEGSTYGEVVENVQLGLSDLLGAAQPQSSTEVFNCEILFKTDNKNRVQPVDENRLIQFITAEIDTELGTDERGVLRSQLEVVLDELVIANYSFNSLDLEFLYIFFLHQTNGRLTWQSFTKTQEDKFFPSDPVWTKYGYCF